MSDIFDNTILCNKCGKKMQKVFVNKNGFKFRAMVCPDNKCKEKIIHPKDEEEYVKFKNLKDKEFRVKMRLVGNSYAVSIPKEIVSFMQEMQELEKHEKEINDFVKLCFEDMNRLSLNFGIFQKNNKLNKEK